VSLDPLSEFSVWDSQWAIEAVGRDREDNIEPNVGQSHFDRTPLASCSPIRVPLRKLSAKRLHGT